MKRGPFVASILVLTEDSSVETLRAVRALARKVLQLIDPACGTHRIDLEPEDERAQEAMWRTAGRAGQRKGIAIVWRLFAASRPERVNADETATSRIL